MKTIAVIQARREALAELAGQPMLAHVVNRSRRARRLQAIVIVTTDEPEDDGVEALCKERRWKCFRGSKTDALDRVYRAAQKHGANRVVRLLGNAPLVDPSHIDAVMNRLDAVPDSDLSTNCFPRRTYPRGLEVEAFHFAALEAAWRDDADPLSREGVTKFLYHHPERFRVVGITHPLDLSARRWLVETPEDLAALVPIFRHFGNAAFSWRDALAFADRSLPPRSP